MRDKHPKLEFPPPHKLYECLLPHLAQTDFLVVVLVENLGSGQVKVLLRNMDPPLSQRVHAGFSAHPLQLGPRATVHLLGNLVQVDPSRQVHRPGMDA